MARAEAWPASGAEVERPRLELHLEGSLAIRASGYRRAVLGALGVEGPAMRGSLGDLVLFYLSQRSGELDVRLVAIDSSGVLYDARVALDLRPWSWAGHDACCAASLPAIAAGAAASDAAGLTEADALAAGSLLMRAMHFGLPGSDLDAASAGAVSVRLEPFFAARAGGIAARGRF